MEAAAAEVAAGTATGEVAEAAESVAVVETTAPAEAQASLAVDTEATASPSSAKLPADGEAVAQAGPARNPMALRHERLSGTISKYVPSSGLALVRSKLFEGELGFKTENIMPECQSYAFQEGEEVEFDVQADERGHPQAVALKPMVGRKPTDCLGQRHRGYVRRFADRWGFLNSAVFDGDLFVHRDNLLLGPEQQQDGQPTLRSGQPVEFDVALDDRGRTVAKQITTAALLRPVDWMGRRLHGYVRSFQGAWGFINSDRFAGDLFVHRDSLLPHCQGVELTVGTTVEFDVERDHHKKGGKNRLVARQVDVLHQPPAAAQAMAPYGAMPAMMPQAMPLQQPGLDPALYGTMPGAGPYGGMNPNAASFAPVQPAPMYYQGALPEQQLGVGYAQPPYPYADPNYLQQQVLPPQAMYPPVPQAAQVAAPQMAQPMAPNPYGQMQMAQAQYGQPQYGQLPYGQPLGSVPPPQAMQQPPAPLPGPEAVAAPPVAGMPLGCLPGQPSAGVPNGGAVGEQAPSGAVPGQPESSTMLHITTHDWEPDQPGQLRVRKGSLVNVSHRVAHGWVYAATVQKGIETTEPPAEGWVPQAVAKRVSLCQVIMDWPAEGSGTLGLTRGDLIAVSKEAERGWVYGERVSPARPDAPVDGWLPKKVLEQVLA